MSYQIEFKPRALKDLKAVDIGETRRIIEKIEGLKNDLAGNVRRLTHFTPEYRLRVGSYRVLFEVEGAKVESIASDIKKTLTLERKTV